jgi:imidazolonepropionase-like amidohydrolase
VVLFACPVFAHGVTRYEGGQWFNGRTFEARSWYSVEGVLRSSWEGKVDSVVRLQGRFIVPPLADAHTHEFSFDQQVEQSSARFLANGIFYLRNQNGSTAAVAAVRSKLNRPETVDVVFANGGITAPGGHPVQIFERVAKQYAGFQPENNAYFTVGSEEELARKWPAILAGKPDFIKAYLESSEEFEKRKNSEAFYGRRGLSPAMLRRVVEMAHGAKLRVSVHVTTAADFRNAVAAGADEIAHLPLEKLSKDDANAAAKRGVVVVTTTLSHRPTEGIDVHAVYGHNLNVLHQAGVRLAIGTDSGRTALDELLNVSGLLPISRAELLSMATEATPAAMFPGRKVGRLAEGHEASFLALEANPLDDLSNLRKIALRVKQGHAIAVAPEKPQIADLLMPVIMQSGAQAALTRYSELRKDASFAYDDSEAAFNRLGYLLLAHGKIDDAIVILTVNSERFPQSFNVWDSLGEAWLKKGDRAKAGRFYRKSLELNPHNENARKALEGLE